MASSTANGACRLVQYFVMCGTEKAPTSTQRDSVGGTNTGGAVEAAQQHGVILARVPSDDLHDSPLPPPSQLSLVRLSST